MAGLLLSFINRKSKEAAGFAVGTFLSSVLTMVGSDILAHHEGARIEEKMATKFELIQEMAIENVKQLLDRLEIIGDFVD